jgi:hypothetical protein
MKKKDPILFEQVKTFWEQEINEINLSLIFQRESKFFWKFMSSLQHFSDSLSKIAYSILQLKNSQTILLFIAKIAHKSESLGDQSGIQDETIPTDEQKDQKLIELLSLNESNQKESIQPDEPTQIDEIHKTNELKKEIQTTVECEITNQEEKSAILQESQEENQKEHIFESIDSEDDKLKSLPESEKAKQSIESLTTENFKKEETNLDNQIENSPPNNSEENSSRNFHEVKKKTQTEESITITSEENESKLSMKSQNSRNKKTRRKNNHHKPSTNESKEEPLQTIEPKMTKETQNSAPGSIEIEKLT